MLIRSIMAGYASDEYKDVKRGGPRAVGRIQPAPPPDVSWRGELVPP
jgi:hypothetical protein